MRLAAIVPSVRRLCTLAAAVFIAATAILLAPPPNTWARSGCPDVEVVFARGTDEPPGVGKVGGAFVDSLRRQTKRNVNAYGVNYPADKDFLAATNGANDASGHVQQMADNCPEHENGARRVLAGCSRHRHRHRRTVTRLRLPTATAGRRGRSRRRGRPVRESVGPGGRFDGRTEPEFRR